MKIHQQCSLRLMLSFIIIFVLIMRTSTIKSYSEIDTFGYPMLTTRLSDSSFFVALPPNSFKIYSQTLLDYTPTSATLQFSYSETFRSSMTALLGSNKDMIVFAYDKTIYIFQKDGTLNKTISNWTSGSIGKWISLEPTYDGGFVIATADSTNKATILLYDSSFNQHVISTTYQAYDSHIACIAFMASPYNILCVARSQGTNYSSYLMYNPSTNNLVTNSLDNSTNKSEKIEPDTSKESMEEKLILMNDNVVLMGIIKKSNFVYTVTVSQSNDSIIKHSTKSTDGNYAALTNCEENIWYISMAALTPMKYAVVCRQNSSASNYRFAVISITESFLMSFARGMTSISLTGDTLRFNTLHSWTDSQIGLFYNSNSNSIMQVLYAPNCEDYEVNSTGVYINSARQALVFTNYVYFGYGQSAGTYSVKIYPQDLYDSSITSVKIYVGSSGSTLASTESTYGVSDLYYEPGGISGTITYAFSPYWAQSGNVFPKQCKLIFKVLPCYTSCYSCTQMGSETDMKCSSCDKVNGYYPTVDSSTQCYDKDENLDHYFFDEDNQIFRRCNEACLTCNTVDLTGSTQCTSCDTNSFYYPWADKQEQCYHKNTNVPLYYFDVDKFSPCYTGCLTCATWGIGVHDTQCLTCDLNNGYYPWIDKSSQCYKSNDTVPKYIVNNTNQIFEKCNIACKYCTAVSTDTKSTQCSTCDKDSSFYPLDDDSSQCYKSDDWVDKYVYQSGEEKFMKCNTACLKCLTIGQSENQTECDECDTANEYYPLEEVQSQCYAKNYGVDYYYFNENLKMFIPCEEGCISCNYIGPDKDNTICAGCDSTQDFYPLIDDVSQCFHKDDQIDYYFYDENAGKFLKCYTGCWTCAEKGISQTETKCLSCDKSGKYYPWEDDSTQCYHYQVNVPKYFYDESTDNFIKCFTACETCNTVTGSTSANTQCLTCDTNGSYYPLPDKQEQCYKDTDVVDGYYFDYTNYKFVQCSPGCSECTLSVCIRCNTSNWYYPLKNSNPLECYKSPDNPSNTFLNANMEYEYCNIACATCNELGVTPNDTKCTWCMTSSNYYPIYNHLQTCINESVKDIHFTDHFFNTSTLKYEQCNQECLTCVNKNNECIWCNNNDSFYKVKDTTDCVNETNKPHNYYLDNSLSPEIQYVPCYNTCDTCSAGPTTVHNCWTCINGHIPSPKESLDCVERCPYYYYYTLSNNEYTCTVVNECPNDYEYLLPNLGECQKQCDWPMYIYGKQCWDSCPPDSNTVTPGTNICEINDICRKSQYQTTSELNAIADSIDNMAYTYSQQYTYTDKQVNVIKSNSNAFTIIIFKNEKCAFEIANDLAMLDLANCPAKLRAAYNIPDDVPLITLNMNIHSAEGSNQISYAFYHSITGERLDLIHCQNEKVIINKPLEQIEGVDIDSAKEFADIGVDVYDSSDPFFNDVCIPYTSEYGTDVTLEDRRNNFFQNVSWCDEGCEYKGVNWEDEQVSCECEIQTSFVSELLDNPLTGDLLEMLNTANFEIFACYKDVFNPYHFVRNLGGWIILFITVIQLGFWIWYIVQGLTPIHKYLFQFMKLNPPRKEVTHIILNDWDKNDNHSKYENNSELNEANDQQQNRINQETTFNGERLKLKDNRTWPQIVKNEGMDIYQEKEPQTPQCLLGKTEENRGKRKKVVCIVLNNLTDNINNTKERNWNSKNSLSSVDSKTNLGSHEGRQKEKFKSEKVKNVTVCHCHHNNIDKRVIENPDDWTEDELNQFELYDAIKYDKRSFCEFYCQQIKKKQVILDTFVNIEPTEIFPIKAISFFFSIGLYFTLNAWLYSQDSISATFNGKNDLNIWDLIMNELTRCIYATAAGITVGMWIDCWVGSRNRFDTLIKREKDIKVFREECLMILKRIKRTMIIFLIINFIMMLVFWYYCCCFCNVYYNTRISWLIGSLITWLLNLLFPFVLCLISASLRFIGLKYKVEASYKISLCLTE